MVDLEAEIRVLLAELGYEDIKYSDNLAYVLRSIYAEYNDLDRTAFDILDKKIRTNHPHFA